MSGAVLKAGDEYHLAQLREAWRHFDGQMILDRETATPGLFEALRGFCEATIRLRRAFETFRRAQYLRAEAERAGIVLGDPATAKR